MEIGQLNQQPLPVETGVNTEDRLPVFGVATAETVVIGFQEKYFQLLRAFLGGHELVVILIDIDKSAQGIVAAPAVVGINTGVGRRWRDSKT